MKIINKILCFFSVFVLCFPLFCFNVSAEESDVTALNDGVPYVGIDFFNSDNGCYIPSEYIDSSSVCTLFYKNYSDSIPTSNKDLYISKYSVLSSQNEFSNFCHLPYYKINEDSKYLIYDVTNDYILFLKGFCQYSISSSNPIYYFCYSYEYSGPSTSNFYAISCICSYSPLYFTESNGFVSLTSDSSCWCYTTFSKDRYEDSTGLTYFTSLNTSTYTASSLIFEKDFTKLKYFSCHSENIYNKTDYKFKNAYTNCSLDTSMFSSGVSLDKGFSSLQPKTLSEQIYVKLTPDFGLDMDRIDPLTNQSDYFKFEIKNNSDSPIQWCAGIYDPELITADTVYIDSISAWGYVSRTTYYDFSCQEEKGIFRTTYTYSGTLKTGSFNYHYLEPGETFTDVIYWENIKISPNVIYHFFVNAVKTDLNHATLNIDPPVMEESSDVHSVTKIEDSYYNTILNVGSSFRTLESNVFNVEFSCLSMPDFTTTVRSGKSVVNTSGTDRYKQYENYESVSDINGLDTKVNKDYVDPSILANLNNKSNVNVDFDNVGIDDVKTYISYSQDFFNLIKSVLGTFPAFVWVLICFGLTGLIVIAIIKALL